MAIFSSGKTVDQLNKIQSVEVGNRFSGWLGVFIHGTHLIRLFNYLLYVIIILDIFIDDTHKVLCIEMRAQDTSVRVRQIKVLGTVSEESQAYGRQYSYSTIQHRQCENETLKVFRSITFQVNKNK